MKFNFLPFNIEFNSPIKFGERQYQGKDGYILELEVQKTKGIGELSPFIDLHGNTPDEAKFELIEFLENIKHFSYDEIDFEEAAFNIFPHNLSQLYKLSSSSLFCLETCLFNILKETKPKVVSNYFGNLTPKARYNGLYIPTINDNLSDLILNWKKKKLRSIKIKIGRNTSFFENTILKQVTKQHEDINLRLDANLALTTSCLDEVLKGIDIKRIEYLEEPFQDIKTTNYNKSINIALDENLELRDNDLSVNISTWIVKPAIQGGVSKAIKLINEANRKNKQVVISSSFESSLGLNMLIFLAQLQNLYKKTDCGLDTYKYLKNDLEFFNITYDNGIVSSN